MDAKQILIHKAEEYGQSRPYSPGEVGALARAGVVNGGFWAVVAVTAVVFVLLYSEFGLWWALLIVAPFGAFLYGCREVLKKGFNEQLDGLRSYRSIETFSPPLPEPPPELPHPPIVVRPYGGEPYTIGAPALPSRQEALQLTPPVVAEILRASVEEYGGQWSRRKLMRLRVAGQKVSRGMYEELTTWLSRAGILQQERQGGFILPPDVRQFDDLVRYMPNLPGLGGPGGNREGREGGPSQVSHLPEEERTLTLAERRRQKWLECGCDRDRYLEDGK